MRRVGHGVFELTPGPGGAGDPDAVGDIYERIYDLALEQGVPVTFGLFGPGEHREATLRRVAEVNASGGRMFLQTHSRGIANLMSPLLRLPFDDLPGWRDVRRLPLPDQLGALRDPSVRAQLVHSAKEGDYGRRLGTELRKPKYDRMTVLERPIPPNPTVAELAGRRGEDPLEVMIDLILDNNGNVFFVQPLGAPETDDERLDYMQRPHTVMTFSDSGAHVSQIIDSSIQTHLLGYWTRERKEFSLQRAVQMLSAVPAGYWGFHDRGFVREGYVADLNVFDPDRIGPSMPTVANDLPGGVKRLVQKATGFAATVVAGQVTLREGEHTGARPGSLIRSGTVATGKVGG
jgi:N-acyl-D-aspartate/D-glutamate deacylase